MVVVAGMEPEVGEELADDGDQSESLQHSQGGRSGCHLQEKNNSKQLYRTDMTDVIVSKESYATAMHVDRLRNNKQ